MKNILKFLFKLFIIIIAIACSLLGIFFISGYSYYKRTISDNTIKEKFDKIQKSDTYVQLDDLPQDFLDAVISIEDNRFYNHPAIDITSIVRAVFVNIKDNNFTEGGSTITQQDAKNVFFTQEKKLTRKVAEMFTSFDIEEKYSKREILEIYVNINYYGSRILWNI